MQAPKSGASGRAWRPFCGWFRNIRPAMAMQSIELPAEVLSAARFGVEKVEVKGRGFLRIPLGSEVPRLYTLQMAKTVLRGNMFSAFRLSLFWPLASAAALRYAITGDEHGIW